MIEKQRFFDVFYRDYRHDVAISSANPEPLDASRLAPLAEKLLESPDNFFGVVDAKRTILQCYLDDEADAAEPRVVLELVIAEKPGCYRTELPLADALDLLGRLPETFDAALLPGGRQVD